MKATVLLLVGVATFITTYGIVNEDSLLHQAIAAGPIALAAFAVGYAIDLAIFGFVVRGVARWRRRRRVAKPVKSL